MNVRTALEMVTSGKPHCHHDGKEFVAVGRFQLVAGGTMYRLDPRELMSTVDIFVPLMEPSKTPAFLAVRDDVVAIPMRDFGGVPAHWREILEQRIIPLLEDKLTIMPFCAGGHGRTGCFIGSLIALLESPEDTPDPIEAVRERHCEHAVETRAQAEAIFALRRQTLPAKYQNMR